MKITRLRLGKCKLNAYMFEIKLHHNVMCEKCNKLETVQHHLLECKNAVSTAVRQACSDLKLSPTLAAVVLSDDRLINVVFSYLDRQI